VLDYKLFGVLQQHADGKPILVFVSTRKGQYLAFSRIHPISFLICHSGVMSTAGQLLIDFDAAQKAKQTLPWVKPRG
jgi:ATP-dependent DNA helicase HFM1/MER3